MLPAKSAYGQWPASGEIDIVESKGNADYKLDGQDIGKQLVIFKNFFVRKFCIISFYYTTRLVILFIMEVVTLRMVGQKLIMKNLFQKVLMLISTSFKWIGHLIILNLVWMMK